MSALRAHFSSGNSQRSTRSTAQSASSKTVPNDGTTRQPSKLAKKSSKLPAVVQKTGNASMSTARSSHVETTTTATLSQVREQMLASGSSSRDVLSPPPTLRTPSLISGSSVSTYDSPRSNVLRRKPSTIASYVASKRSEAADLEWSTMRSRNENYTEVMDDSVFGIALPYTSIPPSTTPYSTTTHSESLYATSSAGVSNTPSTRYTDSPFSHVPTPSSFSSQSTVPLAIRDGNKLSQEIGRGLAISPIETMRQEKATRRTSMIPARDTGRGGRIAAGNAPGAVSSRTQNSTTGSATIAQHPPELAHLSTLPTRTAAKPTRPSRAGAADLNIAQPTSPVVQSDLPPATFHRRTSSRDSNGSSASHGFRGRFGMSPKPPSERNSPLIGKSMSSAASDAGSIAATSDDKQRTSRQPSTPNPAVSPAPGKTRTFGFLSRKSKDETTKLEKPKREARKMPSAGTGHERYGRFGFGHRNGSVSPSIGGRSPSTDSLSSNKSSSFLRRKSSGASDKTSELDDFLRDRLSPVVLRGSGQTSSTTTIPLTVGSEDPDNALGLTQSISHGSLAQPSSHAYDIPRSASAKPDVSTKNSTVAVEHPQDVLEMLDGKEGMWLKPLAQEKKPARKWNFLQRLQSSPAKSLQAGVAASPLAFDPHRMNFDNAAHSALMDAIQPVALAEVEKLVLEDDQAINQPVIKNNNRRSLLPAPRMGATTKEKSASVPQPTLKTSQVDALFTSEALVQSPESLRSPSNMVIEPIKPEQQTTLHTPELNGSDSPRMPRLSPVGRIPRVVSKRDRDRRLPDASFSRPFASTQPRPNVKPPGALYTQIRELASPVESSVQDFPSAQTAQEPFATSQAKRSSRSEYAMHSATNLFAFPSRKNSLMSYSSSSDTASWMAYSRMQALQDEDVWDEYDDLMDDAALGKPSMYHKASFSSHQSPPFREPTLFGLPPTREPSYALPRPPKPSRENSNTSISPLGQQSMYSLTRAVLSRQSTISAVTSIDSSRNSRISTRSRAASFGEANVRSSHTSFSSTAHVKRESIKPQSSARHGMHPSVNLKLEALMTSKLLSFGRVLFSPAHNEMRLADEPRVLILDGLGSDWSYFVAMFYPQATIYNLGPSGKQSTSREGVQQLNNHRNIAHTALGEPLPFPRGFFTAAVFRFPMATTDPAYHSCITEFKRVLRPGGHLEVTVLDIDLCNAGDRARKAVRGLKTRMQQRQENISLRSLSDFVLQSIGKRGFEEVQRCVIGVPVMCRGSRGSDAGSVSSDKDTQDKAFAKLVEDAQQQGSVDESSDEKLTKSVARVGRWWYSQCYERQVLSTDQSIFADDALLSECQLQGTSFRLLICYAQKPTQARRRTMSV